MASKRLFGRADQRLSCEFTLEGRRHQGIATDLSARGLFVQASVQPAQGCAIDLTLREDEAGEIPVRGNVVRVQGTHRAVSVVVPGGFGVSLDTASEAFFDLLVRLGLG